MSKATQDQPTTADAPPARRLSTAEAALLLGRGTQAVTQLGRTGRLPRERGEKKAWTYAETDVLALKATLAPPTGTMNTAECARYLGVSIKKVQNLARKGAIRSSGGGKGPGNARVFSLADVELYAARKAAGRDYRFDILSQDALDRRELARLQAQQPKVESAPATAPAQRFVLPDVMRNWPILDDRDRVPRRPGYGAGAI
ncbi:helix-turn-helix domain-containing protein [Burkholderia gladioli]|uniref:helix-turn-helix domain-containing protein n=1 Tax=Burkholderia gladioli TaxID=28095 RepID=UPI0019043046|nr:helix-turn-helix domain-containing protein [Burkholderia gladioli]MBJ9659128.1 helix-turn-helix domain-containing protein [Burkholderia gladioli]